MKVEPLEGDYCHLCAEAFVRSKLEQGILFVMCREDFDKFLHNGDWDRVRKMLIPCRPEEVKNESTPM